MDTAAERFVYRIREDGGGPQKAVPNAVGFFYGVSPDAKSLAVLEGRTVLVYPTAGGRPTAVCSAICGAAGGENRGITPPAVSWSQDGNFLYMNVRRGGEIVAVPLPTGRNLPLLPASGVHTVAEAEALPGAHVIHEQRAYMGPNPSVYAFVRATAQRNIYRVSLQRGRV